MSNQLNCFVIVDIIHSLHKWIQLPSRTLTSIRKNVKSQFKTLNLENLLKNSMNLDSCDFFRRTQPDEPAIERSFHKDIQFTL